MKLNQLYSKYIKSSESLLLEFSPGKTESLVNHFYAKHPEFSIPAIKFIINKYAELLNAKKPNGTYILSQDKGQRDIDAIIAKDGDGWNTIFELVTDNVPDEKLPKEITLLPEEPTLVIDANGIKVWEASTKKKCDAIRGIIANNPKLAADMAQGVGRNRYGWCVTFSNRTEYYGYRVGRPQPDPVAPPARSFYFIYDDNRPVEDVYHMGVIQPYVTPHITGYRSPTTLMLTNALNGGDIEMDVEELLRIYPTLRDHLDKLQYVPEHPREAVIRTFIDKSYEELDPIKREESEPYVQRWFSVNTKKRMPFDKFLKLSQNYQNSFLSTRDPEVYFLSRRGQRQTIESSSPFYYSENTPNHYNGEVMPLRSVIQELLKNNKVNLARNIARVYNRLPNTVLIKVDADNTPILTGGLVAFTTDPKLILEKLPDAKITIYALGDDIYYYDSQGEKKQLSDLPRALSENDKAFVEEIKKVQQLIRVATMHLR